MTCAACPCSPWLEKNSLGITGDQLRAPLKPSDYDTAVMLDGFQGGPQSGPHDTEVCRTDASDEGHLISKLNSKTVPALPSFDPSLTFPFHILLSPVHLTWFSFYFFPSFFIIFIWFSSNTNTNNCRKGVVRLDAFQSGCFWESDNPGIGEV